MKLAISDPVLTVIMNYIYIADEAVDDNVLADALSYDLKLLQARDGGG